MQRKKLFQYCIAAVLLVSVSFGFYSLSSDDKPTTAADFMVFGTPEPNSITPPNIQSDMVGVWTQGANIPMGRYHGQGTSMTSGTNRYIFYIGGDNSGSGTLVNANHRYDVGANTWATRAPMPSMAWYTDAATLGNYVYICGGMSTSAFSSTMTTVQRYDDVANSWTNVAPLPYSTAYNQQVGYQDSIVYSIGGFNSASSTCNANVLLYNQTANTWRTATSLPAARGGGVAAINGDTIWYVAGGTGYSTGLTNTVYRGVISQSNRASITWTTTTTYPGTGWHRLTGDYWQCKGIIIGPSSPSGFGTTNQIYTLLGTTWTAQPNITNPTSAAGAGSVNMGNGIWKYIVASGLIMSPPYSILNTQIFTDTLCNPAPPSFQWNLCRNGLSKYIFDNTTLYDTINAVGNTNCTILDVNVKIDTVTHTWDSDLTFRLTKGATNVILIQNRGGSGDNFINTRLNDSAALPISSGTPPFNGEFRPEQPLTAFNGATPEGLWILSINDNAGGDNGYLRGWCITLVVSCPTGGIQTIEIPSDYSLKQNYPNPFNPTTKISFALPKAENVKLVVYDILGREVAVLVNEYRNQGIHTIDFDATGISSGVYFYRIEAGNFTATKRMLLVK